MQEDTGKLHLDPGDRKFELVDFEQFAAAGHEAEQTASGDMTASGRLVWTWETLDRTREEDASGPDEAEEDTLEAAEAAEDQAQAPEKGPEEDREPSDEPADPEEKRTRRRKAKPSRQAETRRETSPEAAFRYYSKSLRRMEGRGPLSALLCVPAVYGTFAAAWGWRLPGWATSAGPYILAGLLILQLAVCYDIPLGAVYEASQRRFGLRGLTVLCALAALLDAFTGGGRTVPLCAVPMLGLCLGLYGTMARTAALRRSLKLVTQSEEPSSAVAIQNAWEKTNCLARQDRPLGGFVSDLEDADLPQQAFGLYAPLAGGCALVLGALASLHSHTAYFACLSAILCGALPLGGGLCFAQPFARLSKSLSHTGAALGGWTGALACHDTQGVILRDRDLLGQGAVTHTGIKVYEDYSPAQVAGYAATVLSRIGGGLSEAADALAESLHARQSSMGEYKVYEGGGLGAEIGGNIVLVGSLSFMRLMGISLPQGAAVKQAVYVSVNGELAGIIGIRYTPASPVRSALRLLQSDRSLRLILAARDFLLTPALVRSCFGLESDRFVYPSAVRREALASQDPAPDKPSIRAAVLAADGLRPLAKVLLGGRQLVRITRLNLGCCLLSGVFGLVMVFYLCFTGAQYSLSAGTVLVYALVWLAPVLAFSRWVEGQ